MPRYARVSSTDPQTLGLGFGVGITRSWVSSARHSFYSFLLMCSSVFLKHLTVSNTNVTQFSVSVRLNLVWGPITLAYKKLKYQWHKVLFIFLNE